MKRSAVPAVRAAYMKNLFQALAARGRLQRGRLRERGLVERVETAPRIGWLPIEVNVRTVEALCAEFGEDSGLALLADCVYEQFETPLWRGFIAPAVRTLGRNPASLGRWIPAAFQIVFRDCGLWSVDSLGDDQLAVEVRELPATLASHRLWLRSLGIGMSPLFTLCGVDGCADLEGSTGDGSAHYRLSWKPARAG